MTDRINSLFVVLENDIRDEDAELIIAAVSQLRGVLTVEGGVVDHTDFVAQARAKAELRNKLWEMLS